MNLHVGGKVVVVGAGMTDHDAAAVAPGLQAEVLLLDRIAASPQRSTASTSRMQMGGVEHLRDRTACAVHRTATYAALFHGAGGPRLVQRAACRRETAKELNT